MRLRYGKIKDPLTSILHEVILKYMVNDTNKILRAVLNGQSAMKSELLTKIGGLDKKIDGLDKKIDGVEERLTKRIDKIGLTLASLEDDAPTIEEFDNLEKRVAKVEQKIATAV